MISKFSKLFLTLLPCFLSLNCTDQSPFSELDSYLNFLCKIGRCCIKSRLNLFICKYFPMLFLLSVIAYKCLPKQQRTEYSFAMISFSQRQKRYSYARCTLNCEMHRGTTFLIVIYLANKCSKLLNYSRPIFNTKFIFMLKMWLVFLALTTYYYTIKRVLTYLITF